MYHAHIFDLDARMAVYTQLEFSEIEALVAPLALGRLVAAHGIAAGVENTTYFLDFAVNGSGETASQYVLTIAETLSLRDLEFIATLMHDLDARGLPVPAPVFVGDEFVASAAVLSVRAKPALLVPRVAGVHPRAASPVLCGGIGTLLAELHLATSALGYSRESHRSLAWVAATGKALLPHLAKAEQDLLKSELISLSQFVNTNKSAPQAIIHGDLFRDNVLIQGNAITAIIDFFSAGTGYLLFDLAVVVNDWCFDRQGALNTSNYNALIKGYHSARAPHAVEVERWDQLLRIAALRFWVSRLSEQLIAGPHAPLGRGKDPTPYRRLVLLHRHSPLKWAH